MEEILHRFVENLFGRLDGPLHFRIILQPLMAIIFAIVDGVRDARLGRPAYLWGVILNPEHRKRLLKEGWKHAGRIFIFAVVLDLGYQLYVQHAFYPGETLVVAFLLAIVPYVVVRGPVNRIARLFRKTTLGTHPASRDTLLP
jgi:hypothetical protein